MNEIKCPYDLNQFILGEPTFENLFRKKNAKRESSMVIAIIVFQLQ